ncbi:MAG: hypothetical protein H6557_36410 [Lewinellaceae bacterium]|nr:hypothetical protein [Phaeodactylibacter sp.]MCB9042132.1 hypothetical protein [Lewinellaceae bacterium]
MKLTKIQVLRKTVVADRPVFVAEIERFHLSPGTVLRVDSLNLGGDVDWRLPHAAALKLACRLSHTFNGME